jgi:hypothetical protein
VPSVIKTFCLRFMLPKFLSEMRLVVGHAERGQVH